MSRVLAMIAIALVPLATACAGPQVTQPADGPRTASELLARALARPMPRTLQGMGRLDSYVEGVARKVDVLVRLARPDKAQFQILSPTMDMLAVLATDGERFVSYERGARRCFTGRACPSNLARLVPIALPATQLVATLLGRPPLLPSAHRTLHWDEGRRAWRLHIGAAQDREQQDVWVAHGSYRFRGSVLHKDGKRAASIAYGDLPPAGSAMPPRRMRLQVPGRKIDMSIELRDVTLDDDIDLRDFSIPCPTGTLDVRLPCDASETNGAAGGRP